MATAKLRSTASGVRPRSCILDKACSASSIMAAADRDWVQLDERTPFTAVERMDFTPGLFADWLDIMDSQ